MLTKEEATATAPVVMAGVMTNAGVSVRLAA